MNETFFYSKVFHEPMTVFYTSATLAGESMLSHASSGRAGVVTVLPDDANAAGEAESESERRRDGIELVT